jgi:ABC-type phosphate transport system substrate-binding protein
MKTASSVVSVLIILFLCSCQPDQPEGPTKGVLVLPVPESIAPSMKVQIAEFLKIYAKNGADVRMIEGTNALATSKFVLDTVRLAFLTQRLTDPERDLVRKTAGDLIELTVAYDGIVAVVHYKNPTDRLRMAELRAILTGTVSRWEKLSQAKSMRGPITTIFQDSSDVTQFLEARFALNSLAPAKIIRTQSSLQTLQSVVANPGAIAFVGLDWIDSAKVPAKALELSQTAQEADTTYHPPVESFGKFYGPHPAHIHRSYYPLKRSIIMYSKSVRGDVAAGFGTWVANKEGQKLFLARRIVPATQPIRLK